MKALDLLHRWTGGLFGLLLAVLGLSGAILVHKTAWIDLPHVGDAQVQEVGVLAGAVSRLTSDPGTVPQSILFAARDFGLHRLRHGGQAGAYADQTGAIVAAWDSKWGRPELWLFDLHHYLLAGDTGATAAGVLALVGIGFVVSGAILWWRLRRTFRFRLWPRRMSRGAILRHHRDLGIVVAPILLLSMLTGAMLTLKPVATLLLSPWSSAAEMRAGTAKPDVTGGRLARDFDWAAMFGEAQRRFPTAEFRSLALPREPGDLIVLRMKQPEEWLPNGRTMLWFAPESGRLVAARDALTLPTGLRLFNMVYPLHAASVGGIAYKLTMTLTGLALTLLGTLAVWTFWLGSDARKRLFPGSSVTCPSR